MNAERITDESVRDGSAMVPALEVFRIAGGDVECQPEPTADAALDCLRNLRACYDESLAQQPAAAVPDDDIDDDSSCAQGGAEWQKGFNAAMKIGDQRVAQALASKPAAAVPDMAAFTDSVSNFNTSAIVYARQSTDANLCTLVEARMKLMDLHTQALASNAGVPELPQLDDEMRYILGMPNFQAGPIAHRFRRAGAKIECKSEHEQAFVIDWLLRLRIKHGPEKWREVAATELQAAAPSPQEAK